MFIFEGANIVRGGEDAYCAWCDGEAEYTVHGPDETEYYCTFDLQRFLIRVIAGLEATVMQDRSVLK